MSNLDTNHVVNLDLVKDRVNSVIKFSLADVETSDFYLGLYNNGSRVFDKNYIVMLYIVKPNGNFRTIELEPKKSLKKYYCNLPDSLKNISGEYVCQAVILDKLTNEKKVSKSKFKYSVDLDLENEMAGIIDEEEQESILTNILNRLLTLENPVEPYATQKHVDECVSMLTEEIDSIKIKDVDQDGRLVNIESKNTEQDERLSNIESKNTEQDGRLDVVENKNQQQDSRLDVVESKNTQQDNRLDSIEAVNVSQNTRLDAIEIKNQQQDDRLLDVEKVNKRQDMDLKCLFAVSKNHMIDVTEEGNSIYLQNSTDGYVAIDEIQGQTLVNCNKEPDKEIILNGNINTQGYSNITLTEGVDGGLVDVALEGNTMVNVCDQKDPVAITKSYTVETGNHVALQGEYDGKCRPVVTGNTLVNIIDSFGSVINAEADFSTGSYKCTANGTARHLYYKVIPKTSTTYTAIAYVNKNTINDKFSLIGLDVTENNSPITIPTGFTGLFVSKFTTKADNLDNIWETDLWKENTEGEIEIKGFMILEGDWTNKEIPGYFTGLQSSFEDKVVTQEMVDAGEELAENLGKCKAEYKVTGKNKFDINRVFKSRPDTGFTISGNILTVSGNWFVDYIVPNEYKGKTLTMSYKKNGQGYIALFKYDKGYFQPQPISSGTTFVVPNNANQYRFVIYASSGTDATTTFSNIQLEEGSVATPYEPYKEYKKTFYLNSPLLEGDTIEQSGDNVVHVHRSEIREYQTDDELTLPTDMTNTLVAKATPTYEVISRNDTILCDSYVNGHLDVESAVPIEKVVFEGWKNNLKYLYPNTNYILQFESDNIGELSFNLGATLLNQSIVKGINKFNITTPSNMTNTDMFFIGIGFNASNIVVTEATDQDFGYFEGMKSVGECEGNKIEILSHSKNYCNTSSYSVIGDNPYYGTVSLSNGIYHYIGGDKADSNFGIAFNKIKLNKNTQYTISYNMNPINNVTHTNGFIRVVENGVYIAESLSGRVTFTAKNTGVIDILIYGTVGVIANCEFEVSNIQIEKGSANTSYIPPAENKKQIFLNESLRAVGDIKDKYVLIDGKWYIERKCKEIKPSTNIDYFSNAGHTDSYVRLCLLDQALLKDIKQKSNCLCDTILPINSNLGNFEYEGVSLKTYLNYLYINVYTGKCSADIEYENKAKDRIKTLNPTIICELASPVYEPIDYNPLEVYSEVTHISNNSTIPCNMTIKNTGYNCLLKPNTTYTVSSNLGLNTVTTPSTLAEDCLRFYDTDTSTVTTMNNVTILEGDYTTGKPLPTHFSGIESAFEQEYDEAAGKYKVKIRVQNEDASKENYIEFYINEPLRGIGDAKDKVYIKNDKVVVERNCEQREYQDGDFGTYLTDKVNTVYPLAEPTYEEVEYNDVKLFIESFKNSTLFYNSNIPVTSKVWYSYSVPIVDTVAQTANISDQQDSMIIDMATQVAVMEIMLM